MKVIDLLKLMHERKAPNKIRFMNNEFKFIENDEFGNYIELDSKNERMLSDYNILLCLNDFIEILDEEDEFIDIEEFSISYSLDYIYYKNIDVLKNHLNKDFQTIFDTLDKLIKNQKLIINKLKEEGK